MFVVVCWSIWGQNTTGFSSKFFDEASGLERAVVVVSFFPLLGIMFFLLRKKDAKNLVKAVSIVVVCIIASSLLNAGSFLTGLAIAIATSFAFAAVYYYPLITLFAIAVAIVGSSVGRHLGSQVGLIVGAIAFVACSGITYIIDNHSKTIKSNLFLYYILLMPLFVGFLITAARYAPHEKEPLAIFAFATIYLGIMPLCNAIWDWISLGVTRWLLTIAATRKSSISFLVTSLFDVAAASLFLVGLASSMAFLIALMNHISVSNSGPIIIDLMMLIQKIRQNPYDASVYWIYLSLITTFVPTLLHLFIMVFVSADLIPTKKSKDWMLKAFDFGFKHDAYNRNLGALYFVFHRQFVPMMILLAAFSTLFMIVTKFCGPWALDLSEYASNAFSV
ncbi:MAG: hypothetical protein ABL936_14435 [Aestuariivirga sp.]